MEDTKKPPAELVADLMLDHGFVLVQQDRYEELLRALWGYMSDKFNIPVDNLT